MYKSATALDSGISQEQLNYAQAPPELRSGLVVKERIVYAW